jgi:Uma2 family endonuclease
MVTDINQLDFSKTYTYADYLTWQFSERVELIRGRIFKMSPAPSRWHQRISTILVGELFSFLKEKSCEVFHAPFDVRLTISEDIEIAKKYKKNTNKDGKIITVVQPDVCVVCDCSKLDDKGCCGAPDLVIEILSHGNTKKEVKDKFEIYQEGGVSEYWLIEPSDKFVLVYRLKDKKYIGDAPYTEGDVIKSNAVKGFELNVTVLFN